jgi:6-phosphogluconolactonase (cycloisomerase 2 family)
MTKDFEAGRRSALRVWLWAALVALLVSCGGGGGGASPPPVASPLRDPRAVLLPDFNLNQIRSLSFAEDASDYKLTLDYTVSTLANPIAGVGIFAKCYYFANEGANNVGVFPNDTASNRITTPTYVAVGAAPSSLALSPTNDFLYVANFGSDSISTFGVNQSTCALTPVGTPVPTGNGPGAIVPFGTAFLVANGNSNTLQVYTQSSVTGVITPYAAPVTLGAFPYSINYSQTGTNTFVIYTPNLNSDNISVVTFDFAAGVFTGPATSVPAGDGPVGLFILKLPNSKVMMYAINANDNTIITYALDAATGALTREGAPLSTFKNPSNFLYRQDKPATFIYTTHYDTTDIKAFSIDQTTGALTSIGSAL